MWSRWLIFKRTHKNVFISFTCFLKILFVCLLVCLSVCLSAKNVFHETNLTQFSSASIWKLLEWPSPVFAVLFFSSFWSRDSSQRVFSAAAFVRFSQKPTRKAPLPPPPFLNVTADYFDSTPELGPGLSSRSDVTLFQKGETIPVQILAVRAELRHLHSTLCFLWRLQHF